jgi:hypothetical protein
MPGENSKVSPEESVMVAVMSGYVPGTEVVRVKLNELVPVLVGCTNIEPRYTAPSLLVPLGLAKIWIRQPTFAVCAV